MVFKTTHEARALHSTAADQLSPRVMAPSTSIPDCLSPFSPSFRDNVSYVGVPNLSSLGCFSQYYSKPSGTLRKPLSAICFRAPSDKPICLASQPNGRWPDGRGDRNVPSKRHGQSFLSSDWQRDVGPRLGWNMITCSLHYGA